MDMDMDIHRIEVQRIDVYTSQPFREDSRPLSTSSIEKSTRMDLPHWWRCSLISS